LIRIIAIYISEYPKKNPDHSWSGYFRYFAQYHRTVAYCKK